MVFAKIIFKHIDWEKFEKTKWSTNVARNVLDCGFLTIANLFLALAIQFSCWRRLNIILAIVFFAVYFLVVAIYAAHDDYIKQRTESDTAAIADLKQQVQSLNDELSEEAIKIKGCEEAFSSIQSAIELSAKNLNILRHDLLDDGSASEAIWNFSQTCAVVCKNTFNILVKLYGNEQKFEVSYISYKKRNDGDYVSHMLCYETRNNEMPSIFDRDLVLSKRIRKNTLLKRYCFEKILFENTTAPVMLLTEEEVKANFKFASDEKKVNCKYKQYVAIPICCEAKKPIGLLQIASFQNNLITGDEETVNQTLITLLRPLAYLSLLANKTQDCIDLLGGKQ